jgi:uncharacterized protein HemX
MSPAGFAGFVIVVVVCVGAVLYPMVVWFRAVALQKTATRQALESQDKAIAMEERSLAISEEALNLQREANDLLRQLVEKSEQSGRS